MKKFKNKILLILGIFLFSLSFVIATSTPVIELTYNFSNFTSTFDNPYLANSIVLRIFTPSIETTCYYTETNGVVPNKIFDGNYGTRHEKFLGEIGEGIHNYYIICGSDTNPNKIMKLVFKTKSPVYGTLELSKEPPLKEGQYEITLTTSKECSETPKLEYTLDGITKKQISLTGSGKNWKGYLLVPKNIGETIGSFEFEAYDVYGSYGTKLFGDSLFIVDTVKPEAIGILNSIGYEGQISLNWFYSGGVKEFNIYRSQNPQVDYTDFYKTTNKNYYIDNNVERGKTYYYRVAGVDQAGNIADLSKEVYATSLLENNSYQDKGLDISLIGIVDNKILEINSFMTDVENIKKKMDEEETKESELFQSLNFNKKIDGILSELNALKREVENYKLQDLSKNELENKLNSAELKLNIIKKKTPEGLVIIEETSIPKEVNEQNVERSTIEYLGDASENYKKEIEFVLNTVKEKSIKITSNFYNVEIVYTDGSRKDITVVEEFINSEHGLGDLEDFFFIAIIPKNIAEKASDLEIINTNYKVIKEDPVLLFYADTKKITYYLENQIAIGTLEEIILSPIKIINKEEKQGIGKITGNIISSASENKGSLGIIILVLFAVGLLAYFLKIKGSKEEKIPALNILEKVKEVGNLIEIGKNQEAKELYSKIKEEYKSLSKKEKKLVIEELKNLNGKLVKW